MEDNKNLKNGEGESENKPNDTSNLHKPENILNKNIKNNPSKSKSAPGEEIDDKKNKDDYLSSIEYYINYYSMKPVDPSLPKPTYKTKSNIDSIKESKDKEVEDEEDEENEEDKEDEENEEDKEDEENKEDKKDEKQHEKGNYYANQVSNENMGMNQIGYGMYNPELVGMVSPVMNQMNPYFGMNNIGVNSFTNIPQYENMIGMSPPLINANARMNPGFGQNNLESKASNKKKGKNSTQGGLEQMTIQNQMFNDLNNNQNNGNFVIPQPYPMMYMNMNYLNNQGFQTMMQMNQINNIIQGDMNNYQAYNNMNYSNYKTNNDKNKKGDNFEVIKNVVELSKKDKNSSILVQTKYEEGDDDIKNKIFEKLKPEIFTLSKDTYGNYVMQKVLDSKDEEKNNIIMESFKGKIYELTLNSHGCRVLQKLITVTNKKNLAQITLELKDHFIECSKDQNGNQVIQCLIKRLKKGENNVLYDLVFENIIGLSKDKYGVYVIQALLGKCNEKQLEKIIKKMHNNVKDWSKDQHGNFIIQYILENEKGYIKEFIYKELEGNIFDLSINEYASNVIEKALPIGNENQRKSIINEIIKQEVKEDGQIKDCLLIIADNKFGNHVVQEAYKNSDEETRSNIYKRVKSSPFLKKEGNYTEYVISYIEKNFNVENLKNNLDLKEGGDEGKIPSKIGMDKNYI